MPSSAGDIPFLDAFKCFETSTGLSPVSVTSFPVACASQEHFDGATAFDIFFPNATTTEKPVQQQIVWQEEGKNSDMWEKTKLLAPQVSLSDRLTICNKLRQIRTDYFRWDRSAICNGRLNIYRFIFKFGYYSTLTEWNLLYCCSRPRSQICAP